MQKNTDILWSENPYLDFRPFDTIHAPIFHGRSHAVQEVLQLLTAQSNIKKPFLVIYGNSGIGKSSLLKAGLLPVLLADANKWNIAHCIEFSPADKKPQEEDFSFALARALTQPTTTSQQKQQENLTPSTHTYPPALPELLTNDSDIHALTQCIQKDIATLLKRIKDVSKGQICLLLDPLDEIFTHPHWNDACRLQFFALLRCLVDGGIMVIATLRSQYMKQCEAMADFPYLRDVKGYFLLKNLSRAEILCSIIAPAHAAGISFEKQEQGIYLAEKIADDALAYTSFGQGSSALGLLEYALFTLYTKAQAENTSHPALLRFKDYAELGFLHGTMAHWAQESFVAFAQEYPEAEASFERTTRQLVTLNQQNTFHNQKAPYSLITQHAQDKKYVDAFIQARILVIDQEEHVYFAHESLLLHWKKLHVWLDAQRPFFVALQRLRLRSAQWHEEYIKSAAKNTQALLAQGKALDDAVYICSVQENVLNQQQKQYVAASRKYARKKQWHLGFLTCFILACGVLLATVGFFYEDMKGKLQIQKQHAQKTQQDTKELIEFLLVDLQFLLRPLGKLSLMDALYERTNDYFIKQGNNYYSAQILQKHGLVLAERGKIDQALALLEKAVAIFQNQVQQDPKNKEYQVNLSLSLQDLASILAQNENYVEALLLLTQSIDITRAIVTENPQNIIAQESLATALMNKANILYVRKENNQSFYDYREAFGIYSKLIDNAPLQSHWQHNIFIATLYMAKILRFEKRFEEALQIQQDGLKVARSFVELDPENKHWQHILCRALNNFGTELLFQRKTQKALEAFIESWNIGKELHIHDPKNTQWKATLALTLKAIGRIAKLQNNIKLQHTTINFAIKILRESIEAAPHEKSFRKNMLGFLETKATLLFNEGKKNESREFHQEKMKHLQNLIDRFPNDVEVYTLFSNEVLAFIEYYADSNKSLLIDHALKYVQEALAIYPNNIALLMKRSLLLNAKGDMYNAQKKKREATAAYREGFTYYKKTLERLQNRTIKADEKENIEHDRQILEKKYHSLDFL